MRGIQKHSRADRDAVVREMTPLIQRKFGSNLIALAAQGSYARNADYDYSDLELIAFVSEMPDGQTSGGMGKIRDGMLVELQWMTAQTYLETTLDVQRYWFISASDQLLPIINEAFIRELCEYKVDHLREKCLKEARERWSEVQESTTKVLNAVNRGDVSGVVLPAFDMFQTMLAVLSLLNQTPYTTQSRFIDESGRFAARPAGFPDLCDIMIGGQYGNLELLEKTVTRVFTEFEAIFDELGIDPYDDNVDPNLLV